MKFIQSFASIVSFATVAFATTPVIISPPAGAVISPGVAYDFKYQSIADYGITSYNYSVWLLASLPSNNASAENYASGHFFGRFSQPNYPGNPNPPNPPPSKLVMPTLFQMPAAAVKSDPKNCIFYLTVLEEYGRQGVATTGYRTTSVVYNGVRYNMEVPDA